jgi:hypothetical protein
MLTAGSVDRGDGILVWLNRGVAWQFVISSEEKGGRAESVWVVEAALKHTGIFTQSDYHIL